jgi:hypothetical protein
MAEDDYVEGLNGEEIINDFLDQVEGKLHSDCNLRVTDSYPGGYDGWFEYHLQLRGMDTAEIHSKVIVGAPPIKPLAGMVEKVVEGRINVPLETQLNVVRERSNQDVPTLSRDESGNPVIQKRRYQRRNVEAAASEAVELSQ